MTTRGQVLVDADPGLRSRARAALDRIGPNEVALLVRPAPVVPAEALLALAPGAPGFAWAPPEGSEWAGIGECVELRAAGAERFSRIRDAAELLWPRLRVLELAGPTPPKPRLFGGFAFSEGAAREGAWSGFGDARFTLPRFSYAREGDAAWLWLALDGADAAPAFADGRLDEMERLLDALARPEPVPHPGGSVRVVSESTVSEARWARLIAEIREGIAAGRYEKVVAARRLDLELEPAPDPAALLARLRRHAPECTRFAFRGEGATFLGATPERLLARSGLCVETEALAGSIRPGGPANESLLLASGKDHREHELVVRDLLRCLKPIAHTLEYSGQPQVHALRHVLHLRTPVLATLRRPHHALDLVERLHPTPAVGGVPTGAALEWIAAREPAPRGWYAGPVGWFDAEGDGEFAVALRSGLILGGHAHLYAGAGIVADSDAASEYAETRLKLAALLDALAVEG